MYNKLTLPPLVINDVPVPDNPLTSCVYDTLAVVLAALLTTVNVVCLAVAIELENISVPVLNWKVIVACEVKNVICCPAVNVVKSGNLNMCVPLKDPVT